MQQLYNATEQYADSYYACLILIRDTKNSVFGALLDTCPQPSGFAEFTGGTESFVFTLKPEMKGFVTTGKNDYIMLAERTRLDIGFEKDGPAIHLDEGFQRCSTYSSLTFENDMLHGRPNDSATAPDFTVQELEFFII